MRLFLIFSIYILTIQFCSSKEWKNAWLDPFNKYHISWISDDDSNVITFVISVETCGWIGFGLSPNGGMRHSDIVIGWVTDNGVTHFHDRYAEEEALPEVDESQDWTLIDSRQNITHTVLKFSRPYFTCDTSYDRDITRDTIRVIYAYGDNDPKSVNQIFKHKHHQRGSKSMNLVVEHIEKIVPDSKHVKSLVINVKNITIANKKTTYWCKLIHYTGPQIHAFKETNHRSSYSCNHPDVSQLLKYKTIEGFDCTADANMPQDFIHCYSPLYAWAVGGEEMIAPNDVGFPLGTDVDTTYLILQIHYDNPEWIENRVDSSGFIFSYTRDMRKYEAFTLMIGSTFDYRVIIPPKQESFQVTGHCDTRCFDKFMDNNGFNIIAVMPHMHNIGKTLKLRHFRGNRELPWIINENNYDFNFQSFRDLRDMVNVKPGDLLTTECTYNSLGRKYATLGGQPSDDEMCVSMLVAYPRIKNAKFCFSGLTIDSILSVSELTQLYNDTSDDQPIIKSPVKLQNKSLAKYLAEKSDWNSERLQYLMTHSKQHMQCYYFKTGSDIELNELIDYPKLDTVYKPTEPNCQSSVNSSNNLYSKANSINLFIIILSLLSIVLK